ncbi:trypsin-like peptidase domain-containing protein [Anianabacter salinae]|uniref:trypsin-like peptidase domain-containing protein n=1 Tax=Anianabacter salinae TaxID=2851023 RepID=UPI00225E0585|nr:trypsin-like peptidase domain-containing protein [Anianabacter salinae]MBV0914192.1 trypsin-like peptidase domain-containing protein [Anianabacter salinae]
MPRLSTATVLIALSCPGLAAGQDLVGFDRASFGKVVLSQAQSGFPQVQLESAVGNYNNESIQNYSPGSIFAQMGRSVGRLDILTDAGIFPCTAFIVDDTHLLTNHHCVPGILDNPQTGATRIEAVQFVAGYTRQGVEEGTERFVVNPAPVEAHRDLDYALLEVTGNPAARFGSLALSDRIAEGGDPYWVIGHPMGEAQRISREQCRANVPPLSGGELLHTCDTLPGNSGSPVIDASLQRVVGLHHAGSKRDSVNFAIPMASILERSSVLRAALDAPEAPAPLSACDRIFAEAKESGACHAYEAMQSVCAGDPMAALATAFIARNCTAEAVAVPAPPVVAAPRPVAAPVAAPSAEPDGDLAALKAEEARLARQLNDAIRALNVATILGDKAKIDAARADVRAAEVALNGVTNRITRLDLASAMQTFNDQARGPGIDWEHGQVRADILPPAKPGDADPYADAALAAGRLAAITEERLTLWNTQTNAVVLDLDLCCKKLKSVALSPDGRWIAVGTEFKRVLIFDATGAQVADFEAHGSSVTALAFAPDGARFASAASDGTFRIWAADGEHMTEIAAHARGVTDLAFAADGTLFTTSYDKTARAWDTATGRQIGQFEGHTQFLLAAGISADGKTLITSSKDGTLRIWEVATGRETAALSVSGAAVTALALSPDGRTLATGDDDGLVHLWDIAARRIVRTFSQIPFSVAATVFSEDGTTLAAAGGSATAALFHAAR